MGRPPATTPSPFTKYSEGTTLRPRSPPSWTTPAPPPPRTPTTPSTPASPTSTELPQSTPRARPTSPAGRRFPPRRKTLTPRPENSGRSAGDATGTVTITGQNIIGHEVTAYVSDLADTDGVPTDVTYSYQWVSISIPDAEEIEIPGATGNTYRISETFTVTDPITDMERTVENYFTRLKVRVGFTDSAGNAETLASDAWPASAHITYGAPTAPQELTVEVRGPDQLDPV